MRKVGTVFALLFLAVSTAVWLLERGREGTHIDSFFDAVWFAVCTVSTVGYGDAYPVTAAGRVVVGLFILVTMLGIGFLLTAINDAVLEVKRMEENGLLGTSFDGHIVVCGFSPVARTAIEELLAAGRDVALICDDAADLAVAQRYGPRPNFYATAGEISQDVLRDRLNAVHASTGVVATDDDTANIVAALNLRAVNPKIRVVVAVKAEALRQTLIASGVTYVASPFELSGRLVASAAFEPEVARFVDDISSGLGGYDLAQFSAEPFAGKSVEDIRRELIDAGGPLLVGVARFRDGAYDLMPHPPGDHVVAAHDHLLVVCDKDQADVLTTRYGVRHGR
jgi:voltage-gated potassium channel